MNFIERVQNMDGKVAVITGGAGLLGGSYGEVLGEAGASIVVADVSREAAESKAHYLSTEKKITALPVTVDISNPDSVDALVAATMDRFGRVDVLINNAAMTAKGGSAAMRDYFAAFEEYPLDLWQKALDINLTGMFLCSQRLGRQMARGGRGGAIINISSTYGNVSPDPRLYEGVNNPYREGERLNTPISYAVTKGAVLNLTRYLAIYWAAQRIRVNSLTPGGVFDGHDETFVKNYSYRTPLGRMANKDEYKAAVLFLASDASSYMTGSNLIVDGGWTAW